MKYLTLIVLGLILLACSDNCACDVNDDSVERMDSIVQNYLDDTLIQNRERSFYGRRDEPILYETGVESYRLTYSASLSDYHKFYRIQKKDDIYQLRTYDYCVRGWVERRDSLLSRTVRDLTNKESSEFLDVLDENCFWTIPVSDSVRGLDGSFFKLEGFKPGGNECTGMEYYLIGRWSPHTRDKGRTADFIDICDFIRSLDPIVIPEHIQ